MRAAFKKALEENMMDHHTRGVFADWLEENGHDDEATIERDKIHGLKGLEQIAKEMNRDYSAEKYGEDDEYVTDRAITVVTLLEAGDDAVKGGMFCFGRDDDPQYLYANEAKFWLHWAKATGKAAPPEEDDRRTSFRCAC